MRIEALSQGKNLDAPEANEDLFLVLPGRGFAVIDGVTDIGGRSFDGMSSGRAASGTIQQAVVRFLTEPKAKGDPAQLIAAANAAMQELYARHGVLDAARCDPKARFGATLTAAIDLGASFRFVLIGDSGLRLNGREIHMADSPHDRVTGSLRVEAYRAVAAAGGSADERARVGRACAFWGVAQLRDEMAPWIDANRLAAIRARCLEFCRAQFPNAPVSDLEHLIDLGVSGQTKFQNVTGSPFSYSVIDGFDIPTALMQVFDLPRAGLSTLELFTDGYFKPGAKPELAAWESAFAEVEREDPEKLGRYAGVKGSSGRMLTDDRTLVILHL